MFNRVPPVDYVEGNQGANLRSSAAQRQQAFRDLRRNIRDISEKALSAHFRELERDGIVLRREFREGALLATVPSPTTAAR
jgi:DNA-binding HxlR family transcriptional regulator